MFIITQAAGIGAGDIDSDGVFTDLIVIANETGIGRDAEASGQRRVTYTRGLAGPPQLRLDELINTAFTPDYGLGNGPQAVDIVIVSVPDDFVFGDGSFGVVDNGTALAPSNSGQPGAQFNTTVNCLILYDTLLGICCARAGTGGTINLPFPGPAVLYHELSHARRIVRNELLSLVGGCDPPSPEERAAVIDENDVRTQIAALLSIAPELRDPDNYCADVCPPGLDPGCCIVASLVSGSPRSAHVQQLRQVRDHFVRSTDTGHEFFEQFFYDYYGFSPQVCTMIAGRPRAREAVLTGFVEPLLDFWQIMAARSHLTDPTDETLGALLYAQLPPAGERAERLRRLQVTAASWEAQHAPDADLPDELFTLLRERAWPLPTVQWALIDPLRIYAELLAHSLNTQTAESLGGDARQLLDAWSPRIPLANAWGSLDAAQLAVELQVCERGLLQTSAARRAFRQRLSQRFPTVTAIQNLLGEGGEPWQ